MRVSANGRAMIVGADRLDYSKGLPERFLGYEHFLATHPERHGKVFLLQIAPVSRDEVATYQDIHNTLDSLAGRINGSFANIEWGSEEHTSELQSLMRISYAVFCLKKKKHTPQNHR